tara:strand:+ start:727 stop:1107 length:381 start_codon:yes stop_codon:yes gene_type:complete
MSREYWVPEGIWRIIKSYFLVPEFYIGDVIYGIPKRLHNNSQNYNHFAADKCGIIVDKTGKYKEATYYISVPEFDGDYLVLSHLGMNIREKKINAIEKLIMVNKFGEWWYPLHKSVFQEIMIEALC